MEFGLGVDLGTTSTVAAVAPWPPTGRAEVARLVQLGSASYSVPSAVAVGSEGSLLAGEAAERRGATNPSSVVREYKRRFGDPAPFVVERTVLTGEELMAAQLADVLERVERSEGGRPNWLALTHPAAWGPFRLDSLREVARRSGYDDVALVAEPVAAAVANRDRLADGALVAVYDLGGGTFDAAVVRCSGADADWTIEGVPEGVERLGGADIDQAVLGHVDTVLGGQVFAADSADPETRSALLRLRVACREAKEQLSEDTDVEVPVELPGVHTRVRLTRSELETMIRPRLADSLSVLDRVVSSAGVGWDDIDAVLLVGGSSRIPAVAQLVQEHCGRPVLTGSNPQLSVALGAARFAVPASDATAAPTPAPNATPTVAATASVPAAPTVRPDGAPAKRCSPLVFVGIAVAVVALAVGAVVTLGGGDDDGAAPAAAATTVPATVASGAPDPSTDGSAAATASEPAATEVTAVDPAAPTASIAALQAAALSVAPCTATLPGGELTGIAADGDRIVVAIDGGVVSIDGSDPCNAGAIEELSPSGSGQVHVAAAAGRVVAAGPAGGSIIDADGAAVACDALTGPLAINEDLVLLVIGADGATTRVETDGTGCSVADTGVYPEIDATAAAFVSTSTVLLGGVPVGDDGPAVSRHSRRRIDWTASAADADTPYVTIDAVAACGESACALDRGAGMLHLLDRQGQDLGSVAIEDLATAAGLESGATPLAMAASGDGSLSVAVGAPDGTNRLVRVVGSGT